MTRFLASGTWSVLLIILVTSPLLPKNSPARPKLIMVVVIDQGRADYLERFSPAFQGGLARLLREGVIFSDAHQNHAITATGPGHASISSGAYPSRSGIVGNQWYEQNGTVATYCVGDKNCLIVGSDTGPRSGSAGRSPRNLLVTTFPDWLKKDNPESKVFAASRKDRASILLAGKNADAAYWYDAGSGEFISSTYYMERLPGWVADFHATASPVRFFGEAWQPLPDSQKNAAGMGVAETDQGWFTRAFPHSIGNPSPAPDPSFFASFGSTPLMDIYLLEFVRRLINEEELGRDENTDYLGISLSALDSIGHTYGPHSFEILDEFLRIDAALGTLFDQVEKIVGRDLVIVFSADHGVMELPEYRAHQGLVGHRLSDEDVVCIQNSGKTFLKRYGAEEDWFLSGFYLNQEALTRHGLARDVVEREAAQLLEQCHFIRKVWTRHELEAPSSDHFHHLFRNSFLPGRSPDLMVQAEEYFLSSRGTGTSHGSAYRYDTHVPLIFSRPGWHPRRIEARVATVDIAPTLASLLELTPERTVDGRDLTSYLEQPPSQ